MAEQGKKRPARPAAAARPARVRGRSERVARPAAAMRSAATAGSAARAAKRTGKPTKAAAPARGTQRTTGKRAGLAGTPARTVKIKELNAQGKCGPGTSVVHLFRVDEVQNGTPAVHLVFFDRHGWYCEHGRSCHAVDDVRKLAGSQATRTYPVG